MSRSTTPHPPPTSSSAMSHTSSPRSTPTPAERRRSVVCFNDQCAVIPEVENIKPHLGKRTYSIPLARKPSPDLYYDPTFTPDPRKCLKISLPHLSRAPPIRKPGRRLSTGGTSLFGYRGKDADGACKDGEGGLKGCLVNVKEVGSVDGGEEDDEFDEGELRMAQKRKVKVRRLSLQSLEKMEGRGMAEEDPMSVLRVLKGCGGEGSEAGSTSAQINTNAPPSSYKPIPSASSASPATSTGGSGGSKWSSRPNILTRRTNSTDKVPSSPSSGFSMGASLRRWTSDSDNSNNNNNINGQGQAGQATGKPECILEDQPLVLPSSPTSTTRPALPFSPSTTNTKLSRTPSSASTATTATLDDSNSTPAYLPLRACCAACCRATERGLDEDWEPPMSKRAKRKWEVGKMAERMENGGGGGTLHYHSGSAGGGSEGDDEDDEKPLNVVVDEVDCLRRRRSSGGSNSLAEVGEKPASPSPGGGIWLCSGKGGSRSGSAASSPKGSLDLSPNHGVIGPGRLRVSSAPSSPLNEMGAFPGSGSGAGAGAGRGDGAVKISPGLVDWEAALEKVEAERGGEADYFSVKPLSDGTPSDVGVSTPQQVLPPSPSKTIPLIQTNGNSYHHHVGEKPKQSSVPSPVTIPDDIAAQLKAEAEAAKKMPKTPPAVTAGSPVGSAAGRKDSPVRGGRQQPERKKSQGWLKGILGGGQARGVLAV